MNKLPVGILLGAALLSGACGSSSNNTPTDGGGSTDAGAVNLTISGTAAPHPLSAATMQGPQDFSTSSMVAVALADPVAALADPTAPPPTLVSAALDTSATNCPGSAAGGDAGAAAAGPCLWSFPSVDVSRLAIGLVGIIDNSQAGTNRLWVRTGTGIASQTTINDHKTSRAPIAGAPLFAVSRAVEGVLVTLVNGALGLTLAPGDLEARGFLIGHIVGKMSQGLPPVAGATVSVPGNAAGQIDILYPNATFSGVGTSTASHGLFLGIPHAGSAGAVPFVASWSVTGPGGGDAGAGDGGATGLTWTGGMAGTSPKNAFVIVFAASE